MKKICLGLFVGFTLAFMGVFLQNTYASVNDFKITDFSVDYYLGRAEDNTSTLKTIEYITAVFPEFDQNHGLERFLPNKYDKHNIGLKILSIVDESGNDINYSEKDSDSGVILRIGDSDTYVHGEKNYVITYTSKNVTRYFSNTGSDEFYWDVNGTGWLQSFDLVTANLYLESAIYESLTDKMSCYYGVSGANNVCPIDKFGSVISASVTNLKPQENVTIAIGFKPGTFKQYQKTTIEYIAQYIGMVGLIVCAIGAISSVYIVVKNRSAKSSHAIVPEYLPPKDIDLMQASVIFGSSTWLGATYIDLAVRHKIKIFEQEKGLFKKTNYRFELVSNDGLTDNEKNVIITLFGENAQPGAQCEFKPNSLASSSLAQRLYKIYSSSSTDIRKSDYYIKNKEIKKLKIITLIIMVIAVVVQFFTVGIDNTDSSFICLLLSFILTIIAILLISLNIPLSQKGRDLKDYLKGLKIYIKVGEQERIKILQSPEGAEKTTVDTNDKEKLIHLYERVLPYAVLFGLEKNWSKVLQTYYSEQNSFPGWYIGVNGFNAANFQSSITSFSSSSSSSSVGGSGGGGSSGGGGGGGGGGGW